MKLKGYQQRAIDTLGSFLNRCKQGQSVGEAYGETLQDQGMEDLAYRDNSFEQVPYVCFRIPTGGGKTILGSYAITIAASRYLDRQYYCRRPR